MVKQIDYGKLVANIKQQINTLEYDSMRSAGKTMTNANTLDHLYALLDRFEKPAQAKKPAVKPAQK